MENTQAANKTKWTLDSSHSEVSFSVKHLMITNIKGIFKEFDASIYTTGSDFVTAEIDFWLNPASIDTRDAMRDEHLMGPDFFDVENHKQITFIGNTVEQKDANTFDLYGELTIKGITKQIKLDVEFAGVMKDPQGNPKAGFIINGEINRKDWDLNWNTTIEAGGFLVSDIVKINCEIQLKKAS